jgi:hypothetical protein
MMAIAIVTISVHGYETSGVQGTILFLTSRAAEYASKYNIVVCPCVSPWGYVGSDVMLAAVGATAIHCCTASTSHELPHMICHQITRNMIINLNNTTP